MKKKILVWIVLVLIVSGWVAFLIEYGISYEKIKKVGAKNLQLINQLSYVNNVSRNINSTVSVINKTINDLQKIKAGLIHTKNKLEIIGNTNTNTAVKKSTP